MSTSKDATPCHLWTTLHKGVGHLWEGGTEFRQNEQRQAVGRIHGQSDSSKSLTCESTRLSAREERLESEGSRSRRCALVRDPSLLLPPSVVELADLKVAIVDAARASIVYTHSSDLKPTLRHSCHVSKRWEIG